MKEQILDCQAETKRLASQTLGSIRVVRSCMAERYEEAEYNRALNHIADIKKRKSFYTATFLLMRRVRIASTICDDYMTTRNTTRRRITKV